MMKNIIGKIIGICLAVTLLLVGMPFEARAAGAGALNTGFGGDGKVVTDVFGGDDANGVAVQPDGKIVVVGRSNLGGGGAAFDFFVVRYNSDGSLDTTFDTDGKVTTDFGNIDEAVSVIIQSDGKIVVAGTSDPVGAVTSDFAVARYNANGSLDTTFDTDGKVITDIDTLADIANVVKLQTDGKIVVVGDGGGNCKIARYLANGALDTSFSGDGKFTIGASGSDQVGDAAIQADGKIVAVGTDGINFSLYRINTNGTADTTFDTDGIVTTDISAADRANAVAIQPDGKIIAAGSSDGTQNSALARYNTNGSLDTTFDTDGKVITNFNPAGNDSIRGISLQSDGKIVGSFSGFGGTTLLGTQAMRYNANGSLDLTFGTGGGFATTTTLPSLAVNNSVMSGDKLIVIGSNGTDISVVSFNLNITASQSNDFDGDGTSDFAVYRPSAGAWFILNSGSNTFQAFTFGTNGDIPVEGDFDGDGRTDITVFRPSTGTWFRLDSSNNGFSATSFGMNGDKPSPGDYDKDGKTDIAVWRPSLGSYFILRSSDGAFQATQWGANGDIPIAAAPGP